jgi:hypothetical protein
MLLAGLLALAGLAHAEDKDTALKFDLDGYYRTRGYVFRGFYPEQDGPGRMMVHRLRLQPSVNFQDRAKFFMMVDALDDVVWGDNESLASTPLFAGDPSTTGTDGQHMDALKLKRAWIEFKIPIGLVRVGRQESNWGMGLLSNHGNGFDDSFGENHYGSTFDRAIFATRPVAIAQTIMGKPANSAHPLVVAVGVDRLVEDPLLEYYGFPCEPGLIQGDSDQYDSRCDEDGDGITDLEHDYTDEGRIESLAENGDTLRPVDWAFDSKDDVWEMVYVLLWKEEDATFWGSKGDRSFGTYVVTRSQEETNSKVLIADVYGKLLWRGVYLEGEVLNIRGRTDAIALRGAYDPYGDLTNPLYKEANIWGYVGRAGYQHELGSAIFETGYASGDGNVADSDFTGRPLHPDYNVGLLLYEEVLSRVTATTWSEDAQGLWSNGGVYNSKYIFPTLKYKPGRNLDITAGYLLAWPDKPDGSRILCNEDDYPDDPEACSDPQDDLAKELGWEADLALKYKFHDHILFSAEYGYAKITNRIPLENIGLDPAGKFQTFQTRIAYEF